MEERYSRNMNMLTAEENESLKNFKVCVIGCGGLGGYNIEFLGRLGIGTITAVDGDVFEASNLNRQILSDETILGQSKAITAKNRMAVVNSDITVNAIFDLLTEENAKEILTGHDVVVDALDNMPCRKLLERCCCELNIPLVHGAIAGWYAQVCTIMPGDNIFNELYPDEETSKGIESDLGNPSFTPALAASIQVSEVLKILLNKEGTLRNKLLSINLMDHEYEVFQL